MISEYNESEQSEHFIKDGYAVGLGILWDKKIHGNFPSNLQSEWIVMEILNPLSFWDEGHELVNFYKYNIQNTHTWNAPDFVSRDDYASNHEIYKNYVNIIQNNKYYSLDIYKIYCQPGLETVGVKKTFWIKIIQRRWKKLYKERLNMINKRKSIESLKYRERHGAWPIGMKVLPSIKDIINF